MNHHVPLITVLMPAFNGEKYLRQAIDSILNQTFTDFEFIIVNDGSTDKTLDIIESYKDPRIRLINNEKNMGLAVSLNKGIDLAQGKYIARMDCDYISLPHRLAKQVAIMERHPEIGVCGTLAIAMNINGKVVRKLRPPAGKTLKKYYWRPSPFVHPSCLMRTAVLRENRYDPNYEYCEDYELWLRLSSKTEFYNIKEFLLIYRVHDESASWKYGNLQMPSTYKAFLNHLKLYFIDFDVFFSMCFGSFKINPVKRAYYLLLISLKTGFDLNFYVLDNLKYFLRWIKHRLFQ